MENAIIDSRQLRAFVVLAQHGTFTQAGRVLHLTQSAISHAIRVLEKDLGCQLFLRQGKQVLLTHHGRELLHHAEAIQLQMVQARASLGALDRSPRGSLRIGCTPAAAQFLLPTVLREFKDSFPLYSIAVLPGETPETMERLAAGELDLGLCLKPHDASRLESRTLFEDDLVFLVSPQHAWCRQAPKARELSEETYIITSRNSLTFDLIGEYFLKLGVRPKSFMELGNIQAIKELVKLGLGTAIAAPWTSLSEIRSGELTAIPLLRNRIKRQWIVCHLKQKPTSLAEHIFMGLCEEAGASLARPGE